MRLDVPVYFMTTDLSTPLYTTIPPIFCRDLRMSCANKSIWGFRVGKKNIYGKIATVGGIETATFAPISGSSGGGSSGGGSSGGGSSGGGAGGGSTGGGTPKPGASTGCTDTLALRALQDLVTALYNIIETSFPPEVATSAFIAKYTVPARANPFTFVRFAWIKENPGKKLYPSKYSALVIKDLYLQYDLDWTNDPLILAYLGKT